LINRDNIFLLSGIASIGFYISVLFFFFVYTKNHEVKKIGLSTKETFLELEVISAKVLDKPKISKQISIHEKSKDSGKLRIKSKSISTKRVTNLKSLFAKTNIKSAKINKSKALNITKTSQISRYKSKFEKQRKAEISKLLKSIDTSNAKSNLRNEKVQYDTDKYYSKIKEIITLRWYTWNTIIVNNLTARVVVFIDKSGHFSYRILKHFGHEKIDGNLENFLNSETTRIYPKPQKSESIEIIFRLEKE